MLKIPQLQIFLALIQVVLLTYKMKIKGGIDKYSSIYSPFILIIKNIKFDGIEGKVNISETFVNCF